MYVFPSEKKSYSSDLKSAGGSCKRKGRICLFGAQDRRTRQGMREDTIHKMKYRCSGKVVYDGILSIRDYKQIPGKK